jgi:hypothetical protein
MVGVMASEEEVIVSLRAISTFSGVCDPDYAHGCGLISTGAELYLKPLSLSAPWFPLSIVTVVTYFADR